MLVSLLMKCKRVAFVLPEHLCKSHSIQLQRVSGHLSIGKDTYLGKNWLFTLSGAALGISNSK